MTLILPSMKAISDSRTKFLRCRICRQRFRNDKLALERLVGHLESKHPYNVLSFWREVELAEDQARRDRAAMESDR